MGVIQQETIDELTKEIERLREAIKEFIRCDDDIEDQTPQGIREWREARQWLREIAREGK